MKLQKEGLKNNGDLIVGGRNAFLEMKLLALKVGKELEGFLSGKIITMDITPLILSFLKALIARIKVLKYHGTFYLNFYFRKQMN